MAGKALKASGKRVMKYSRDGAVERDLLQQSEIRISDRTEDAVLKTEAPADELFGKDHKPQEQAEQPKHQKLRFIDEQQDTGSKLQADYATHREETPLTFETTAPVPTTSVENTETTIPEKPMSLDDRSESAEQSEPEPEYSSGFYEDWRSGAGTEDVPIADKTTNFDFRAGDIADKNGKSHKSRKFKFGKEPEDTESADIKPEKDDKRFPKHSDDDFSFTGEKPELEDEPLSVLWL